MRKGVMGDLAGANATIPGIAHNAMMAVLSAGRIATRIFDPLRALLVRVCGFLNTLGV